MKTRAELVLIIFLKTIYLHIFFKLNKFNCIINKYTNLISITKITFANPFKITKFIRLILKFLFLSKNCFHRSFITASVLKTLGIKVNLVIGVSCINSFKSHAWIEVNGIPILENDSLSNFEIIYKA